MTKDPTERLGCGPNGHAEIRGHPFFHGINWQELEEGRVAPPFTPDTEVLANFDKEFTEQTTDLDPVEMDPQMKEKCENAFVGFDFTSQEA